MNTSNDKNVILVVEDELPLLKAIQLKLEGNGFSVVTARSVDQALDYTRSLDGVSAIWLDHYLLGSENGLDFVTQIKKEGSKWREIPIFLVSNTASPNKIQSYISLGVDKYFTKANSRLDDIIADLVKMLTEE